MLQKDSRGHLYQAFPIKGGFQIVSGTTYTSSQIGASLLGITTNCNLTMQDGNSIPMLQGSVIALHEEIAGVSITYTFDTSFIGAIA